MKLVRNDSDNSDFGLLGRGIEIAGEIIFTERLQVDGRITGKLTSPQGTLIVGETGHIEAQVDVGVCVIYGTLNGDLCASSRVEVRRTGKVHGDIVTPVLLVEEGAVFNGAIKMTREEARLLEEVRHEESEADAKRRVRGA